MTVAVGKRHTTERPLRRLTDHELLVLDELGKNAHLFRQFLKRGLDDLGELAMREMAERDYELQRLSDVQVPKR